MTILGRPAAAEALLRGTLTGRRKDRLHQNRGTMNQMSLSEQDLATINARLITDFDGQVPLDTMIRLLHDYAATHPHASPDMVEQATRIKLQIHRQGPS